MGTFLAASIRFAISSKDADRRVPSLLLSAALAALAFGVTVVRAADAALSEEDARRVEAGEIVVNSTDVPGYSLPRTTLVALIQAPPEKVWAIISDCARYNETMPRVLTSEELERSGDRVHCRQTIDMPFPIGDLVSDTDAVQTALPGGAYKREWKQRDGGDFKSNEGTWTLEPYAGGAVTRVTYEALMEPNVPIPTWVMKWAQTTSMPGMIEGLRKQVTTP